MTDITIGSFNTRGFNDDMKRREVYTWLRNKKLDIFFLQETKCTKEKHNLWESEWGYTTIFDSNDTASSGTIILFNNTFQFKIENIMKSGYGRYIIATITISNNENILLCNMYAPNTDNTNVLEEIFDKLDDFSDMKWIIGGDMNMCMEEIDKKYGRPYNSAHQRSRTFLKDKLIDIIS